jgi:hypothetical protein
MGSSRRAGARLLNFLSDVQSRGRPGGSARAGPAGPGRTADQGSLSRPRRLRLSRGRHGRRRNWPEALPPKRVRAVAAAQIEHTNKAPETAPPSRSGPRLLPTWRNSGSRWLGPASRAGWKIGRPKIVHADAVEREMASSFSVMSAGIFANSGVLGSSRTDRLSPGATVRAAPAQRTYAFGNSITRLTHSTAS